MALDRSVSVTAEGEIVTLAELRDLVESTRALPADSVVRGRSVPFKMADLTNRHGLSIAQLTIAEE
jgi:hypothetical protein